MVGKIGFGCRVVVLFASGLVCACGGENEGDSLSVEALELRAPQVEAPDWQPCADAPGADCAVVRVPLDYDRPQDGKTSIALARIPAADPEHKLGTLFMNPGGPGGSGIQMLLSGFGAVLGQALQGRFDLVGFDPRGVGASEPLRCFETQAELSEFFSSVGVFPYSRSAERPFFDQASSLGKVCLRRHPRIAAHMSTADVARDLDWLRQAVGDERISYLGFSYGTQLGNTYANLFPNKVRALVIDGVLDPRQWATGSTIIEDRLASDQVLAEYLRLCDEEPEGCAFSTSAPGGAAARFDALAEALRAKPLQLPDRTYTYDLFIADVLTALYAPELLAGEDGFASLLVGIEQAVLGDAAAIETAGALRSSFYDRLRASSPTQEEYDNRYDAYYGVLCADAEFPRSFPAWSAIGSFAAHDSRFGPLWWWGDAGCANWPASADRYSGPWSTRTSAPVLVVGNYFDPATGYPGAVASSELLRNSRLLTYAGWGHTAFGRSDCVTGYVLSYLLDGSLPPAGTVCPANANPFAPAPASALAPRAARVALPVPTFPPIGLPPVRPGQL